MKKYDIAWGMPTLLEMPTILESAALAKSLSLSFIEINMNLPHHQIDRIDHAAIDAARKEHGVFFTLHVEETLNPWDFNSLVADAYMETMRCAIDIAQRHDMPVINMHMQHGVHFKLPGRKVFLFEQYKDVYMEKTQKFMEMCKSEIGEGSLLICLENTNGFSSFEQDALLLLLYDLHFALTLDIGHSHCADDVDIPFFKQHAKKLRHAHIHDGNAATCHLPLGEGCMNLRSYFDLCFENEVRRAVVELKDIEGLRKSVKWLA